jgi:hypothetical protein
VCSGEKKGLKRKKEINTNSSESVIVDFRYGISRIAVDSAQLANLCVLVPARATASGAGF